MFASDTTVVEFPELGWGPWELNRFVVKDLFGWLSVAWYGLIICCAMILACFLILKNAKKYEGIKSDSFTDYFLAAIPAAIVGARLMYVLTSLENYETFWDAFKIWEGGLAFYGGAIGGILAVWIASLVKKQSFFRVMDAVVPGMLLAQCIGRWGNFVNGEAHGGVMKTALPWGMMINGEGPFHPTFLYESLLTLTGFILLQFVIYPRKKFNGMNVCFYAVWYGVGRTFIEGMRTDSLYFGSLRASQVIGVTSAIAGAILFFLLAARSKQKAPDIGEDETAEEIAAPEPEAAETPEDDPVETLTENKAETEPESVSDDKKPQDDPEEKE